MKPATFHRIASVLTLIHAILHTIGGVFGKPMPGPAELAVRAIEDEPLHPDGEPANLLGFFHGSWPGHHHLSHDRID